MKIYNKTIYKFIYAFGIIGFQQFNLSIISYLLILLASINKFNFKLKNKFFFFSLFIIISSFFNLIAKGFPYEIALNLVRFYFGPIIIGILVYKSLIIQRLYFIYAFFIWCLIEFFSIIITGSPPIYLTNFFDQYSTISLIDRADIGIDFMRVLRITGPTLNSSITGVFSAIILNLAIFDGEFLLEGIAKNASKFRRLTILSSIVFSSIILLFTFSGTALASFIILFLLKSRRYILNIFLKLYALRMQKVSLYIIFVLIVLLLIQLTFYFIDPTFIEKISLFYAGKVFENKWNYVIENFGNINHYIFGNFYEPDNLYLFWGGDKQLLSFVYTFGLIYLIPIVFISFHLTPNLKSYTAVLILSSLHYGSFFFLTGQILFAHILVSSRYIVDRKKILV